VERRILSDGKAGKKDPAKERRWKYVHAAGNAHPSLKEREGQHVSDYCFSSGFSLGWWLRCFSHGRISHSSTADLRRDLDHFPFPARTFQHGITKTGRLNAAPLRIRFGCHSL
jgi:hypothetical protein